MRLALLVSTSLLLAAGCATTPRAPIVKEDDPIVRLPPPPTPAVAEAMLNAAVDAMRGGQPDTAAVLLDSILRGDHLTERGRANVYWLLAHAFRAAGDEAPMLDAFGGFLVASSVLERPLEDARDREVIARSVLLARRVVSEPRLGKSPEAAIPVEDVRDPATIVAELSCAPGGRVSVDGAAYREDSVSHVDSDQGRLESRHLTCPTDGRQLVLWFSFD